MSAQIKRLEDENRNLRRQLEAEVVPYKNPGLPNTQQQQSTSGGTRANVEPVADISTHSVDNRELLMSVYGVSPSKIQTQDEATATTAPSSNSEPGQGYWKSSEAVSG
ncbi:hypothetical protein CAEBREN_03048 [Caenorhabditis brenneri]|uniref:Uncharacterized protein n=1 Tax=Caenorhabditis brenneri TaxID=135651 RepID=G0PF56_CAEBE|nr:hypothetical protein CAEBREN_03048 [Caenorhabditis brenneri]